MAFIKAIRRVANALGVLLPPQQAVRFSSRFTATDVPDATLIGSVGGEGEVTGYTLIDMADVDAAARYVSGAIGASVIDSVTIWLNDTAASVTVSSLYLVPGADVAIHASNYVLVKLSVSGTPLYTIRTDVVALTQGTAIAWGAAVTVPVGGTLAMVVTGHGTPPAVALYTQGRLPAT